MRKKMRRLTRFLINQFPKIATVYYGQIRELGKYYEKPGETPMGFKLAGNKQMKSGRYEPEETRLVKQILCHVDVFINIGANIGYYSCIALAQGKYVVAFEPMRLNLHYLLRNIRANNWASQIEIYPIALSDKTGVLEIYGGGGEASLVKGWEDTPEQHVTLVPGTTLNNVLGKRFCGKKCFILVDIEGAEHMMLKGAGLMINIEPKPVWLIEIGIFSDKGRNINPNLESTFRVFWNNGYEAWTADKQCRMVLPDEIQEIVRSGIDTFSTHNFLFIEKNKKQEFIGDRTT